eukprot:gene243-4008_t
MLHRSSTTFASTNAARRFSAAPGRPRCSSRRGSVRAVASSSAVTPVVGDDTYQRLKGIKARRKMYGHAMFQSSSGDEAEVFQSSSGEEMELVKQWGDEDTVVVAWMRSLGCPFCQELAVKLGRDIKPQLDARGVRLIMVSIGTPERSKDFVAKTGFPAEDLTFQNAFLDPRTPLSFAKRASEGNTEDLKNVLSDWVPCIDKEGNTEDLKNVPSNVVPWMTPNGFYQALQQGGMYVFKGEKLLFSHKDQATADHADLKTVLAAVPSPDDSCGCEA